MVFWLTAFYSSKNCSDSDPNNIATHFMVVSIGLRCGRCHSQLLSNFYLPYNYHSWFVQDIVVQPKSLSLVLSRVSVGTDMLFCKEGCKAVIDTGSSYITGPAASINILVKKFGATELAEGEVCSICSILHCTILYVVRANRKMDQHGHSKLFLTDSQGALRTSSRLSVITLAPPWKEKLVNLSL